MKSGLPGGRRSASAWGCLVTSNQPGLFLLPASIRAPEALCPVPSSRGTGGSFPPRSCCPSGLRSSGWCAPRRLAGGKSAPPAVSRAFPKSLPAQLEKRHGKPLKRGREVGGSSASPPRRFQCRSPSLPLLHRGWFLLPWGLGGRCGSLTDSVPLLFPQMKTSSSTAGPKTSGGYRRSEPPPGAAEGSQHHPRAPMGAAVAPSPGLCGRFTAVPGGRGGPRGLRQSHGWVPGHRLVLIFVSLRLGNGRG